MEHTPLSDTFSFWKNHAKYPTAFMESLVIEEAKWLFAAYID